MTAETVDRRTILVLDGEEEDQAAIADAARATAGAGSRLLVLFVPVRLAEWAHWELGDDPVLLRRQIEWQQYRMTMRMLDEAGVDRDYRMQHMPSRWRVGEVSANLEQCEEIIVSTSSVVVRTRLASLARRRGVSIRLVRESGP